MVSLLQTRFLTTAVGATRLRSRSAGEAAEEFLVSHLGSIAVMLPSHWLQGLEIPNFPSPACVLCALLTDPSIRSMVGACGAKAQHHKLKTSERLPLLQISELISCYNKNQKQSCCGLAPSHIWGGTSGTPLSQWDQDIPPTIPGTEGLAPVVSAAFGRLKDAFLISCHIVS